MTASMPSRTAIAPTCRWARSEIAPSSAMGPRTAMHRLLPAIRRAARRAASTEAGLAL
jgi:hypothetical protein